MPKPDEIDEFKAWRDEVFKMTAGEDKFERFIRVRALITIILLFEVLIYNIGPPRDITRGALPLSSGTIDSHLHAVSGVKLLAAS